MEGIEEYCEVFGLTPEALEAAWAGGKEQGAAGPAPEEGEKRQGAADPAPAARNQAPAGGSEEDPEELEDGPEEDPEEPEDDPEDGGGSPSQSVEERRRQAELRRQREAAAEAAATQARIDKVYADMFAGQVSPFTGQPIRGEADFLAYQQELTRRQAEEQRQQAERQLQEAGIPPETLRQIVAQQVEQHPAVQQAQQATLAAAHERAMLAQRQAQESISKSLAAISAEFPEVKTLEDIGKLPTAGSVNAYVQQGLPLEDAFFLANRQELLKRQREAAKQAAINTARGKDRLGAGVGGAAGGEVVEVPEEMEAMCREMMPGVSKEEIKKKYQKFLRETGR